ncbi:hypothetical protein B7463_g5392, partial [Scytalidium lignicola]
MASFIFDVKALKDHPMQMLGELKMRIGKAQTNINNKLEETTNDGMTKIGNMPEELQGSAARAHSESMDIVKRAFGQFERVLYEILNEVMGRGDFNDLERSSETVNNAIEGALEGIAFIFKGVAGS